MDIQDQLKKLFPEHTPTKPAETKKKSNIWLQDAPIICKYEKKEL